MKTHALKVFWAHHDQKAHLAKKTHHFRPHQFTHFLTELFSFIRYFRTYGQQDLVLTYILRDKKASIDPYTMLTSKFSYLTWFLRYLHFHVRIQLDPILKNYLQIKKLRICFEFQIIRAFD